METLKRYWENIKNEKLIILNLGGLLTIGLICWLYSGTEQFGLNFFTEMLGVTVTVLIVDRLIQNREERRSIPQKLAAYADVNHYTANYISFWTSTYRECVPEDEPKTIEDFFSENGMTKILGYLYMDSEPNVSPPRKWWDWLIYNAKEFKDGGNKLLDRHSYNLDPIAYGYIHKLTESNFNNMLLMSTAIRQSDNSQRFPRVKILASYSMKPPQEDFEAILGLVKWCNKTYKDLIKHNFSIQKLYEYTPVKNRQLPPKCMIPVNILEQQLKEMELFRQKDK